MADMSIVKSFTDWNSYIGVQFWLDGVKVHILKMSLSLFIKFMNWLTKKRERETMLYQI